MAKPYFTLPKPVSVYIPQVNTYRMDLNLSEWTSSHMDRKPSLLAPRLTQVIKTFFLVLTQFKSTIFPDLHSE
jgi:hypothetical protein